MAASTTVKVCEGQELHMQVPQSAQNMQQSSTSCPRPINIVFNGKNGMGSPDRFVLTEKLLSQHLMLVGGIGSGKTNTFNQILQNIVPQLSSRDVMIIFDTKGDFYKEFYKPGDIVISNDSMACGSNGPDYWNIINELDDTAVLLICFFIVACNDSENGGGHVEYYDVQGYVRTVDFQNVAQAKICYNGAVKSTADNEGDRKSVV